MTRVSTGARLASVAAVVALTALVGCAPEATNGPTTSATSGPSVTTPPSQSSTDPKADMRTRLAAALRPSDSYAADLVSDEKTTLTPTTARWLPGWQVVDVVNRTGPHPQRFFIGLSDTGATQFLTGKPAGFDAMVTAAGVHVSSAQTATSVAELYLDATRPFVQYSYRIGSLADVAWVPRMTAAEEQERQRLEKQYAEQITPSTATAKGTSWSVSVWMVDGRTLVEHTVGVASDGQVSDFATVRERRLPVPASV